LQKADSENKTFSDKIKNLEDKLSKQDSSVSWSTLSARVSVVESVMHTATTNRSR
jgi:hypothetical protein